MLVFDIETKTFGRPDPNKDEFKYIGAYEYETDTYLFYSEKDKDKIIDMFKRHRVIIGFNSKYYDEPILKRAGLFPGIHCHIDLRESIKKRAAILGCKNSAMSLKALAKYFKLEQSKSEIDYDLMKKDNPTVEEVEEIKKYTLQDIIVTKQMYDKVALFFEAFKEGLSKQDVMSYKWLTTSVAVYTYKMICNLTGIDEEYSDNVEHKKFEGGYVADPLKAEEHDNIYCLDFSSLYPHNIIQGNLYSTNCKCCTDEEKWSGNELFPLMGKYCKKKQGKIEVVLKGIYNKRLKYKENKDKREYGLKIALNTIYGLLGNPSFKSLYNRSAAHDCTLIGRQSTKYARKKFMDAGYSVLYSDTDSVFIKDPFKDKTRLLFVKDSIITFLKSNLPFPADTFDMTIDADIKHIWFFKAGDRFKKKNYLYVDNDLEIHIIGLPMIKNDSSRLGYKIFKKYMTDKIKAGELKFQFKDVSTWIYEELEADIKCVARTFKVWDLKEYMNPNQIHAQISAKYGAGVHTLIPNKYVGVGKSIKYCTEEEFKERGLSLHAVILNKVYNELKEFVNYIPRPDSVNNKNNQHELLRWTNI